MDKVENFVKKICWKVHFFFDNPMMRDNDNYTNYGLRSNVTPPQNPDLTSHDMVRNIKFRNVCNDFQNILKEDINKIRFL